MKAWRKPYGAPKDMLCDPGRSNLGKEMATGVETDGTKMRGTAGEAHEKNGGVERAGRTVWRILRKILQDVVPRGQAEYLDRVPAAVDAKDRIYRRFGFSPYQLAFGRGPP